MKACIITIGDEILIGQVIDTNSAYISQQLNNTGISVHRIVSISDNREEIIKAIDECFKTVDIILITGGLGPTNDDITKYTLNEYYKGTMVMHQPTLEHIIELFKNRGIGLTELNRKQALLPDTCIVIPNPDGTAPGMWFENNSKILIALPGVPYEMKSILTNYVIPRLKEQFTLPDIIHRTIMTQGIAESILAEKISGWEKTLPENIKLAYLPSPGVVRLRLSAQGNNKNQINSIIDEKISTLQSLINEYIFALNDEPLEEVVGKLLTEKFLTVSTAESCTGGALSAAFTSVSGSSKYFKGGMVSYGNMVKIENLKVKGEDIINFGAVSEEVVTQMARGAVDLFKTDYAIATSGIAGPTGGSPEKPVGTVWIAVASKKIVISKKFLFGEHRGRNITKTVNTALNMLRKVIIEN